MVALTVSESGKNVEYLFIIKPQKKNCPEKFSRLGVLFMIDLS